MLPIRYWQAKSTSAKSALLDEMQSVTNLHRKSVLRLSTGELTRKPRRQQRGKYGAEVKSVVKKIARSLDYPCAERLQPNLAWLAKQLAAHQEIRTEARSSNQTGKDQCLDGPAVVAANRLIVSDDVPYARDNNGNLLNDGVNSYSYNAANQLTSINGGQSATYTYNGFGDRLSQNGVNHTLDLNPSTSLRTCLRATLDQSVEGTQSLHN